MHHIWIKKNSDKYEAQLFWIFACIQMSLYMKSIEHYIKRGMHFFFSKSLTQHISWGAAAVWSKYIPTWRLETNNHVFTKGNGRNPCASNISIEFSNRNINDGSPRLRQSVIDVGIDVAICPNEQAQFLSTFFLTSRNHGIMIGESPN